MKKYGFLILFACSTLFAQLTTRKDTLLFSLHQLPEDTSRLQVLDQLILEVMLTNPQQGFLYSEKMIQYSLEAGFLQGLATGYSWRGYFYESLGELDSSQSVYFRLIPIYKQLNLTKDLATLYNNIAYNYSKTGQVDLSLRYNYMALEINTELKDTNEIITSLINLGVVYNRKEKFRRAIDFLQKALSLSVELKDERRIAACLRNLARVFYDQQDDDEAYYCYKRAHVISSKNHDTEKMARELNGIGNIYERKKNYSEALHYYQKSLSILENTEFKRELANTYTYLGNIFLHFHKADSGLYYLQKALSFYQTLHDKEGISESTYQLGQYYYSQKQYIKAEELAAISFETIQSLGYPTKCMNSAQLLYHCYCANHEYEKAIAVNNVYLTIKAQVEKNDEVKQIEIQKQKFDAYKEELILSIHEKDRIQAEKDQVKRRNLLQYSLMTLLFLVSFGIIFSMGYIKLPLRAAQALIFVTLLSLFEFLLVLTDPLIDSFSNGIPVYKVLANSVLAIFIFPLHGFLEKRLHKRVKNKK